MFWIDSRNLLYLQTKQKKLKEFRKLPVELEITWKILHIFRWLEEKIDRVRMSKQSEMNENDKIIQMEAPTVSEQLEVLQKVKDIAERAQGLYNYRY